MNDTLIYGEINQKIEFYKKSIKPPHHPKTKEAIVIFFIYKETIDEINKSTLNLFIKSHLKFNSSATIHIFTNQNLEYKNNFNDRLKIDYLEYLDHKIMTNRVIFNISIMNIFNRYDKLFFFDADLIPTDFYDGKFEGKFDIAVTFNQIYMQQKKFPINAGLLIINNRNFKNINKFVMEYLNSYIEVLKNEKQITNDYKLLVPPSEWYGDQFIFQYLGLKFPKTKFFNYTDLNYHHYTIRYLNEFKFNNYAIELKKHLENPIGNFDISEYLKLCKLQNVQFLHLKGNRRLFSKEIESLL